MKRFAFTIRGLVLEMRVGVYDAEKQAPQRLRIDIEGEFDYAGDSDDLAATFDYDRVYGVVKELAAERHWELQEYFCSRIVDEIAAMQEVSSVTVSTSKPDIYADCSGIGVRCSWVRPD